MYHSYCLLLLLRTSTVQQHSYLELSHHGRVGHRPYTLQTYSCVQSEFWGVADALSQLTCAETIAWAKLKIGPNDISYYDRWFLPKFDLNKGTIFFGRPVGNHPEWMIWDDCLNKDVDDGVGYHVSLTSELAKDDKRKFDLSTPARQDRAYLRLLDPALGL